MKNKVTKTWQWAAAAYNLISALDLNKVVTGMNQDHVEHGPVALLERKGLNQPDELILGLMDNADSLCLSWVNELPHDPEEFALYLAAQEMSCCAQAFLPFAKVWMGELRERVHETGWEEIRSPDFFHDHLEVVAWQTALRLRTACLVFIYRGNEFLRRESETPVVKFKYPPGDASLN